MTDLITRLSKLDAPDREGMIREVVSHGFTESQAQIIVDNQLLKKGGIALLRAKEASKP
ncbi:hypothetical protein [Brucella sp. 2280]|uniref:hypothetical protein n=1 Tax=Brucella sp. 2280 TaxID=2592625 RepID=UPI0012959924|nr:hypothetical protein [Brucella sp. 2280]QGA58248.1 hypothetical protein GHC20_14435 [Brucella sp. 2280]